MAPEQSSSETKPSPAKESKDASKDGGDDGEAEVIKFSPEEEAALVKESDEAKAEANRLFAAKEYESALGQYDAAISSCPKYLDYPRAVINSNISACHLQLQQWKEAIKAATEALDGLAKIEREDPRLNPEADKDGSNKDSAADKPKKDEDDDVEEEIVSSGASKAAAAPAPSSADDDVLATLKGDIQRIRRKALMRRGRARSEAGGWQNLAGAEEDYRALSKTPGLAPADARVVRAQLRDLPPRTKAAQEREMGEMWGKLKDLGNGILKPFGLSTENFQMVKDEKTGGYSMNFQPGDKSDS